MTGFQIHAMQADAIAGSSTPWWIAVTPPRQEFRLAAELESYGATVALPLRTETKISIDSRSGCERKRENRRPILERYVPFTGPEEARYDIDRSQAVSGFVPLPDSAQGHFRSQLANLVRASEICPMLGCEEFANGSRVRITAGIWMGLEGYVLANQPGRVRIAMEMLNRASVVDKTFSPESLESLELEEEAQPTTPQCDGPVRLTCACGFVYDTDRRHKPACPRCHKVYILGPVSELLGLKQRRDAATQSFRAG